MSSGNWTSEATWGGTMPGEEVNSGTVIIPEDVKVSLDTDVTFEGLLVTFEVDGELESTEGDRLMIETATLEGSGTLDLDYLEIGTFGFMTFDGDADVRNLSNENATLALSSTIDVQDTLMLSLGNISLSTGSSLSLATEGVIKVDQGTFSLDGGAFSEGDTYTVVYVGSSNVTGMEIESENLQDVYIRLEDDEERVTLSGDFTINGNLYQESGDIELSGQRLTLSNDYEAELESEFIGDAGAELEITSAAFLTSGIYFEEDEELLMKLTINTAEDAEVTLMSNVTVFEEVSVVEGELIVDDESDIFLAENATVNLKNSNIEFTTAASSLQPLGAYNLSFEGESTELSGELFTIDLNNLTILLDSEEEDFVLVRDVIVGGELMLESGDLDLNGHDLAINGDLEIAGESMFSGNEESNLLIQTEGTIEEMIRFDEGAEELSSFVVELGSEDATVTLGNDLLVNQLELNNGLIVLGDNNLEVGVDGVAVGYSENSYVVTNGEGNLMMNIETGFDYREFPVGNLEGFSPAFVRTNNGTSGSFGVRVSDGVLQYGETGSDVSVSESVVDRTWNVSEGTGSSSDIDLMVSWTEDMEVNDFDNTSAYITHYVDGNWDISTETEVDFNAETEYYSIERVGITSLSPFAVKDSESALAVDANETAEFNAYPTPTNGVLYLDMTKASGEFNMILLNNQGQVMQNFAAQQAGAIITLDVSDVPTGMYFIQLTDGENVYTKKIVRQ